MQRLALVVATLATPAMADPEEYGHMMGWGHGHGYGMIFGPVLWLIVLGLVVAGVIWLVGRFDSHPAQRGNTSALAELDMRFARGEIDADDYASRKKLLSS
ncbi:SHOCT domain-containing protein [Ruegeria marina]|uniref:Putative membrane protein n=1 Tax=Ruegeria marina TaxID=639004 RepID=A0A1G7ESW4_9RHOB|nr:SHOCT domain-containing protein [Ruegeria marina]SDE66732.1 putative membrane protein [Ruegeria marina]